MQHVQMVLPRCSAWSTLVMSRLAPTIPTLCAWQTIVEDAMPGSLTAQLETNSPIPAPAEVYAFLLHNTKHVTFLSVNRTDHYHYEALNSTCMQWIHTHNNNCTQTSVAYLPTLGPAKPSFHATSTTPLLRSAKGSRTEAAGATRTTLRVS